MLEQVEWGKYKLRDLFEVKRWKRLTIENRIKWTRILVTAGYENSWIAGFISNEEQEVFPEDTITIDMFANSFYRNYEFSADDNILVLIDKNKILSKAKPFIVSNINWVLSSKYNYWKQYRLNSFEKTEISLPAKNWKIDFEFMENFINQIENAKIQKLDEYLEINWFKNCTLTSEEEKVLRDFESRKIEWWEYNLEKLFWKSTRGKRLKSDDRIAWDLVFVTAGETDEWVSAYIGNNVEIFSENTTTIDMFGSAKYRNYKYGWDDHIAVVHTEKLPQKASIFVTTSIHKTSCNWQFNYGRNFYAKDADVLNIQLPTFNSEPNYKLMETLISAIQKLVIHDVVNYVEEKI